MVAAVPYSVAARKYCRDILKNSKREEEPEPPPCAAAALFKSDTVRKDKNVWQEAGPRSHKRAGRNSVSFV